MSAAHTDSQGSNTRDLGDSRSPRASSEIGTDALPGPGAPADTAAQVQREVASVMKALAPMGGTKEQSDACIALGRLAAWAEAGLSRV